MGSLIPGDRLRFKADSGRFSLKVCAASDKTGTRLYQCSFLQPGYRSCSGEYSSLASSSDAVVFKPEPMGSVSLFNKSKRRMDAAALKVSKLAA